MPGGHGPPNPLPPPPTPMATPLLHCLLWRPFYTVGITVLPVSAIVLLGGPQEVHLTCENPAPNISRLLGNQRNPE